MNGVHDMGGLQDMGPIQQEKNVPGFHAPWEGRMYAISQLLRPIGRWNTDTHRYAVNMVPPVDYLRLSYFEHWIHADSELLLQYGLVSATELASGKPDPGSAKATPVMTAARTAAQLGRGIRSPVEPGIAPLFKVGQQVRARNINTVKHTQLPRYARGKTGVITRDHGVYNFPDTSAHQLGDKRQHVYSVRFTARELWGDKASPRDTVYIDMWDDYLDPA